MAAFRALLKLTAFAVLSVVATTVNAGYVQSGSKRFPSQGAMFGPQLASTSSISGNLFVAGYNPTSQPDGTLGCDKFTSSSSSTFLGNIVMIQRGDCRYMEKVFNAQQAGATAVIVYDNETDLLSRMAPARDFLSPIVIPSFFITRNSSVALINQFLNNLDSTGDGLPVTITVVPGEYEYSNSNPRGYITLGILFGIIMGISIVYWMGFCFWRRRQALMRTKALQKLKHIKYSHELKAAMEAASRLSDSIGAALPEERAIETSSKLAVIPLPHDEDKVVIVSPIDANSKSCDQSETERTSSESKESPAILSHSADGTSSVSNQDLENLRVDAEDRPSSRRHEQSSAADRVAPIIPVVDVDIEQGVRPQSNTEAVAAPPKKQKSSAWKKFVKRARRGRERDSNDSVYDTGHCTVCLEDFTLDEDLLVLPCRHIFHPDCVQEWLIGHGQCPVCKTNVLPSDQKAGQEYPTTGLGRVFGHPFPQTLTIWFASICFGAMLSYFLVTTGVVF